MPEIEEILEIIDAWDEEKRRLLFNKLSALNLTHPLEKELNVRAEVIMEAIHRSPDLTQRGIRGILAETIFVMDVLPLRVDWVAEEIIGDQAYDALVSRNQSSIRIQVKTQRKESGVPMQRNGNYVVEVQRTRTGNKDGKSTCPYRYGEFDLLAVCMWASTSDWHTFMYAAAANLVPDARDATIIKTMQSLPPHPDDKFMSAGPPSLFEIDDLKQIWTSDLSAALERF